MAKKAAYKAKREAEKLQAEIAKKEPVIEEVIIEEDIDEEEETQTNVQENTAKNVPLPSVNQLSEKTEEFRKSLTRKVVEFNVAREPLMS